MVPGSEGGKELNLIKLKLKYSLIFKTLVVEDLEMKGLLQNF